MIALVILFSLFGFFNSIFSISPTSLGGMHDTAHTSRTILTTPSQVVFNTSNNRSNNILFKNSITTMNVVPLTALNMFKTFRGSVYSSQTYIVNRYLYPNSDLALSNW